MSAIEQLREALNVNVYANGEWTCHDRLSIALKAIDKACTILAALVAERDQLKDDLEGMARHANALSDRRRAVETERDRLRRALEQFAADLRLPPWIRSEIEKVMKGGGLDQPDASSTAPQPDNAPPAPASPGRVTGEEDDPLSPSRLADHIDRLDTAAFAWLLDLAFTHDGEPERAKTTVVLALRSLAAPQVPEGHNEPCYYCGEPCDSVAGDPSRWPLGFPHADDPGVVKYQHVGCVVSRLDAPAPQGVELETTPDELAEIDGWLSLPSGEILPLKRKLKKLRRDRDALLAALSSSRAAQARAVEEAVKDERAFWREAIRELARSRPASEDKP